MFFWQALNYLNLCGEEKIKKESKNEISQKKKEKSFPIYSLSLPQRGVQKHVP